MSSPLPRLSSVSPDVSRAWLDDVGLALAFATTGSVLGPTLLRNVLAWTLEGRAGPSPWLSLAIVGAAGGALGYWIRRRSRTSRGLGVVMALGSVPCASALLVLLAGLPPVIVDPSLLAGAWPIALLFDMFRSVYHSVALALAFASLALVDALVAEREPGTPQNRLQRRHSGLVVPA